MFNQQLFFMQKYNCRSKKQKIQRKWKEEKSHNWWKYYLQNRHASHSVVYFRYFNKMEGEGHLICTALLGRSSFFLHAESCLTRVPIQYIKSQVTLHWTYTFFWTCAKMVFILNWQEANKPYERWTKYFHSATYQLLFYDSNYLLHLMKSFQCTLEVTGNWILIKKDLVLTGKAPKTYSGKIIILIKPFIHLSGFPFKSTISCPQSNKIKNYSIAFLLLLQPLTRIII